MSAHERFENFAEIWFVMNRNGQDQKQNVGVILYKGKQQNVLDAAISFCHSSSMSYRCGKPSAYMHFHRFW